MSVINRGNIFGKMDVFSASNINGGTGNRSDLMEMLFEKIGIDKDAMDMTVAERYHRAAYPGETVIMPLLPGLSQLGAA